SNSAHPIGASDGSLVLPIDSIVHMQKTSLAGQNPVVSRRATNGSFALMLTLRPTNTLLRSNKASFFNLAPSRYSGPYLMYRPFTTSYGSAHNRPRPR